MSAVTQLGIALASVGILLTLLGAVQFVGPRLGLSPELQRKAVHIGTGFYALALPWMFTDDWPIYLLIGMAILVLAALRLPVFAAGMGGALHGVTRRSYGELLLAASVALCYFLAEGDMVLYVLPLAILTLADSAAALVGRSYKTASFSVESEEKSYEGSATFFLLSWLIAMICLMLLSDIPPERIIALSVMVAAFGTLVEAQSWRGFDNLFLPLGILVFLSVHRESGLWELAAISTIFLVALFGFQRLGRRFGVSAHAARVYAVALFLVLAVTTPQNAILPALLLLINAWVQHRAPSRDRFGELDIVASLALISFGWLALGNAIGLNAIAWYGMTALGMCAALLGLALGGAMIKLVLVTAALVVVLLAVISINPDFARWAAPYWPWAMVSATLCLALALKFPAFFERDRVLRITPIGLMVPLMGFGIMALWGNSL